MLSNETNMSERMKNVLLGMGLTSVEQLHNALITPGEERQRIQIAFSRKSIGLLEKACGIQREKKYRDSELSPRASRALALLGLTNKIDVQKAIDGGYLDWKNGDVMGVGRHVYEEIQRWAISR